MQNNINDISSFKFQTPYKLPIKSDSDSDSTTQDVTYTLHDNGLLHIQLNRPKALNSLTYQMVYCITKLLHWATSNPNVSLILFTSILPLQTPSKHIFSVGGDIKELSYIISGKSTSTPNDFVASEYAMNQMLLRLQKPTISISDGLSMGGGAGLQLNCQIQIVTENSSVGMPECRIGWIPDVGCTHWFKRLQRFKSLHSSSIPLFLALTGTRIPGHFLASHFCHSSQLSELLFKLSTFSFSRENTQNILSKITNLPLSEITTLLPFPEAENKLSLIQDCFSSYDINTIYSKTKSHNIAWFQKIFNPAVSSTSLVLTCKAFLMTRHFSCLEACLETEYQLVMNLSKLYFNKNNFVSGTHSLLIKRDGRPDWWFRSITQIPNHFIEKCTQFSSNIFLSFFLDKNGNMGK